MNEQRNNVVEHNHNSIIITIMYIFINLLKVRLSGGKECHVKVTYSHDRNYRYSVLLRLNYCDIISKEGYHKPYEIDQEQIDIFKYW